MYRREISPFRFLAVMSFMYYLLVLLGLLLAIAAAQSPIPIQLVSVSDTPAVTNWTILERPDIPRRAYLVRTTDDWSVVVPGLDRSGEIDPSMLEASLSRLERTSVQAAKHGCFLATNGGPYHADGTCVGVVVANSHVVHRSFGGVGFGITHGPSRKWVVGTLSNASQADALHLQHFVTGFEWLVFDGTNVARDRNNTTGAEKSARTAIGVDFDGKLMLLVSDGCEKWYDTRCDGMLSFVTSTLHLTFSVS
jgi:hypothetical protein